MPEDRRALREASMGLHLTSQPSELQVNHAEPPNHARIAAAHAFRMDMLKPQAALDSLSNDNASV